MSFPEDNTTQRALSREWAAARIVVIGGFIVAVAVTGYFAWQARQESIVRQHVLMAEQQAAARAAAAAAVPGKIDAKKLARAELAFCKAELKRAQDITIVPSYARLAAPNLVPTNIARRFICAAKTDVTVYLIAADLRCSNIQNPQCISIDRIVTKEKLLVYTRPD